MGMQTAPMTTRSRSLWETVAANVRAEAARRGYTASSLARELGMNRSAVQARWVGDRQWQLEDLERVASLFVMEPADLLAWAPWGSNPQPTD
ncbi:helix-turn-helix domain-containing protein [Luteipulveratus flavus]|uniref:helix-turn-helix domain-containing protein n=1 Tax=Luteipulveratus flavus TaxID=3031728 RepID=UPI0039082346